MTNSDVESVGSYRNESVITKGGIEISAQKEKSGRAGLIGLAVVSTILTILLGYVYSSFQNQIVASTNEMNTLESQVETLQTQLDTLNSTYLGYVSTHTYSNTEYESLESQYRTYYGDLFDVSGELSPCGEWPPSKSPIGHPSDVPMVFIAYPPGFEEYATAILKICETGFLKYVEVFGLSTADIHIFIRTNQESLFACYSHEYRIFNYLRSIDDCRPPPNGAHHVYGFLHEMGHMVFSTDNGAFNQGWAHYAASRIVDEVYRELGDTAWPRPYNYSKTEGKQRLLADIARTQPGTYDAASGVLYTIDQRHGPTIFKATIDKMHPTYIGVYRYPLYSLEEFKSTLVELTNDESLLELFSENGF